MNSVKKVCTLMNPKWCACCKQMSHNIWLPRLRNVDFCSSFFPCRFYHNRRHKLIAEQKADTTVKIKYLLIWLNKQFHDVLIVNWLLAKLIIATVFMWKSALFHMRAAPFLISTDCVFNAFFAQDSFKIHAQNSER